MSLEFQNSLDWVCDQMGMNMEFIKHNYSNAATMPSWKVPRNWDTQPSPCPRTLEGASITADTVL